MLYLVLTFNTVKRRILHFLLLQGFKAPHFYEYKKHNSPFSEVGENPLTNQLIYGLQVFYNLSTVGKKIFFFSFSICPPAILIT